MKVEIVREAEAVSSTHHRAEGGGGEEIGTKILPLLHLKQTLPHLMGSSSSPTPAHPQASAVRELLLPGRERTSAVLVSLLLLHHTLITSKNQM